MKTKSKTMKLKKSKLKEFYCKLSEENFKIHIIEDHLLKEDGKLTSFVVNTTTNFVNTDVLSTEHIRFFIEVIPMKKYVKIEFGAECSIDIPYFGNTYKQLGIIELKKAFPSLAKYF